jgi:broad specificity phosphatase PhoE
MGVLLLVRHGQASLGAAEYDQLSDLGVRQAQILGARLARTDVRVDRIVCGTLARQRDTAWPVLAGLGRDRSELITDGRLDEYDHVGVMAQHTSEVTFAGWTADGETGRRLQGALEEAISRWMSGGPGYVESHESFVTRATDAVSELTGAPGGTIAVTSGGIIAAACVRALGLPIERWPALARLIVNSSITKIVSGSSGTHLVTFNDHAHLEGDRALISYR